MAELFDSRDVPIHVQVAAAERELKLRVRVYPGRIANGKMTQALADREIANMTAIIQTLQKVMAAERT